jgi:DNA polymerase I-like protein with 3'-5' exonuclease and polymerase domains
MQKLVQLSNLDLMVLLEMETNGLQLDINSMQEASKLIVTQMTSIREELDDFFRDSPAVFRNYNSGDCVSALLYGGRLTEYQRIVVGKYKTGPKTGEDRFRINEVQHDLPRRIDPPKGSELKKQGFYATNEETLRSVKASGKNKEIVNKILELSKLDKLNGTYYEGLPKLIEEKDWKQGTLHGQFNQVVARTGRLSCSSPNLQNLPPEVDQFVRSRYA